MVDQIRLRLVRLLFSAPATSIAARWVVVGAWLRIRDGEQDENPFAGKPGEPAAFLALGWDSMNFLVEQHLASATSDLLRDMDDVSR